MMKDYITLVNSKNFYVGDVENNGEEENIVRVYYDETGLKKLNNILHAHLSMSEWITMIVDKKKKCKKIVAYSEKDNHEYDITGLFSKKLLKKLLETN